MIRPHTDREYTAQLTEIRKGLLRMSGYVDEMVDEATDALVAGDALLAQRVIRRDALVDDLETVVDEQCIVVLARWQPVASDLRFVTLALKMVTDLERMGDLAVNIAERVEDLAHKEQNWSWDLATQMARLCRSMLKDAIDAFLELDAGRAQAVLAQDDELDAFYHRLFTQITEGMQRDSGTVPAGVHALAIAKWYERIGDHATNLAEQVIYLVRGEDVRHHVRFDVSTG